MSLLFDDVLWVQNAKRDHFDFITKMRERGVEVVEMHNLLAETLQNPTAKAWLLDHQITRERGRPRPGRGHARLSRQPGPARARRDHDRRPFGRTSCPTSMPPSISRWSARRPAITEYLLPPLPNTLYTRDTTCWIYGGVTVNPLYWPARHEETLLTTAIYKFHPSFAGKVQVWWGDPDANHGTATVEGGDVLMPSAMASS